MKNTKISRQIVEKSLVKKIETLASISGSAADRLCQKYYETCGAVSLKRYSMLLSSPFFHTC